MANPTDVIAGSYDKFVRSFSDDDVHDFAATKLEHVWKAVREIDVAQRKRQSAQNLRRIEPLLKVIEKYSRLFEAFHKETHYLPLIWVSSASTHTPLTFAHNWKAPIKLTLQVSILSIRLYRQSA
jgi:hypothetical protein